MTHSIKPSVVFEERAAKQMENVLKMLSLFGKRKVPNIFWKGYWTFIFLDCTLVRFPEVPGRFRKFYQKKMKRKMRNH